MLVTEWHNSHSILRINIKVMEAGLGYMNPPSCKSEGACMSTYMSIWKKSQLKYDIENCFHWLGRETVTEGQVGLLLGFKRQSQITEFGEWLWAGGWLGCYFFKYGTWSYSIFFVWAELFSLGVTRSMLFNGFFFLVETIVAGKYFQTRYIFLCWRLFFKVIWLLTCIVKKQPIKLSYFTLCAQ